jgi:hypothetical protein
MSESPYNPIAAALGNAIRDATGARLYETPFRADRLYRAVLDQHAKPEARGACKRVLAIVGDPEPLDE